MTFQLEPNLPLNPLFIILNSTTSNLLSIFNLKKSTSCAPFRLCIPILIPDTPKLLAFKSSLLDSTPPAKSTVNGVSLAPESTSVFPSSVRIYGSSLNPKVEDLPLWVWSSATARDN
ncbi:hypothetical protein CsatB_001255 [Cannabis sativa]